MSVLLTSGMDAFTNLYDVEITMPGESPDDSHSVRALSFTPPELVGGEYTVGYKGVKLTRLNAKITGAREFTIEFRSDADYLLLKALNEWKEKVVTATGEGDINFGVFAATTHDAYGSVKVKAYKADSSLAEATTPGVTWNFTEVICTNIGSPSFTRAGTDATRVSAKFMFMDYTIV
jgi:hypothetical protein